MERSYDGTLNGVEATLIKAGAMYGDDYCRRKTLLPVHSTA
jgi:hypothetical protein